MKRLPEAISLCCILVALLTSGTPVMRSENPAGTNVAIIPAHDTTGLTGFLKVDTFHLDIIPPASGIQFFKDGIVFLSNTKFEGKMLPKHVSFGSIEAYTAIVKDTSLGMHMLFSPSSSFSFPCEATTFSSDYKIMYFTKIGKKEKREKIYRAEYKPNEKGEPGWAADENPLDFCTGNSIYTHPALSPDGKTLIFASDMSGTVGGLDLFIVRKTGEKWSKPENIGKSINTTRNECFPYIDQDNNLFFSSDGLAGYGGYDIFTCKFNGESWDKPMNISGRINSENDDIAFSINRSDGKNAFFTKRRTSSVAEMQLFKVTLKEDATKNNPLSISYIFNGNPIAKTELLAVTSAETVRQPDKEPAKTTPAEVKKELKTEEKKAPAEPAKPAEAKVVIIKNTSELPAELRDKVVYRVQFLSSTKAQKDNQIVINGITYKTYEYFYLNSYRYTIGEFTTLPPAKELQSIVRKSGYPQAFVAAFKNETRSLDLTLFK
jgi:hypothetical protein